MSTTSPETKLILIVDDILDNLQIVDTILADFGYRTTYARNGEQALSQAQKALPDLILLDLMMPDISGIEVCKQLKSAPPTAEIPIIFLTASSDKHSLSEAFTAGAVDYLTKPFDHVELLARISTHLELKHTRDQLQQALVKLKYLAATDALTGVANRRQILELGTKEINRARRYQRSLTALMLDIDHFKVVNDTHGHQVGDRALKMLTRIAQSVLRKGDYLGRLGGEEFVAILPETDAAEAERVAERLRHTLAETNILDGSTALDSSAPSPEAVFITVSIGVTPLAAADHNIDDLIRRVDQALYRAKHLGRNRTVTLLSH
ncbi:MAG: diguanylate cyclase [Cyanobacteria bacterium P01_H01_bin.119]